MQYGGLADIYDSFMYDIPYDIWQRFIVSNLKNARSVLELGCGTGNITQLLAPAYNVTAVDISSEMLNIAGNKLMAKGRRATFVNGDMCNVTLHKPLDSAIAVCDGINYLTTPEKVKQAFLNVNKNIVSGGRFIFDISSAKKLYAMADQLYSEDREEGAYIWRNSVQGDIITMDITFFVPEKDGRYVRFDETHVQCIHSQSRIESLLSETGFKVISINDDYTAEPATDDSLRITFVAEKL